MAIKLIDLIELAIYHHYPLIPEVVVVSTRARTSLFNGKTKMPPLALSIVHVVYLH